MKNLVYKQVYNDKDGNEKVFWNKCGRLIETQKGQFVKLDHIPVNFDGWFSVFEEKPKEEQSGYQKAQEAYQSIKKKDEPLTEVSDEPINLEDIPFN